MGKRAKRLRRPLTEQEVFQEVMRKARWYYLHPHFHEAKKNFAKRMVLGAFFVGPFLSLVGIMGLINLGLVRLVPIILAINAICCFSFPLAFHIHSRKYGGLSPEQQARWRDYVSFWNFLSLGWISLFGSLMMLVGVLGLILWKGYPGWEIFCIGYLIIGIVLWWKRKALLRAIAEPELHPWFHPIRLFFSLSVGVFILFSAITRIILNIFERTISRAFSFMLGMALIFSGSLLFLGLAQMAWILAYLYYQQWRGVEELKV